MSLGEILRDVPLFAQLREDDLGRLGALVQRRSFPKQAAILLQNAPVEGLYVIVSGQVKLVITGEDGREVILATRDPGDFFGEMSLIDDLPQAATVMALVNTELLLLRRDDFRRFLEELPEVTFGLLRAFCRRLRQADRRISALSLLEVRQRVARLLLDLADERDGTHITQPLTQQAIAQMVGSSRESVSRVMPDFVAAGLIDVSRRVVQLPERRRLAEPAQMVATRRRVIRVINRQGLEAEAQP